MNLYFSGRFYLKNLTNVENYTNNIMNTYSNQIDFVGDGKRIDRSRCE